MFLFCQNRNYFASEIKNPACDDRDHGAGPVDAGVPGWAGWAGADGVTLHPVLASSKPLEVQQIAANGIQSIHISRCSRWNNGKTVA